MTQSNAGFDIQGGPIQPSPLNSVAANSWYFRSRSFGNAEETVSKPHSRRSPMSSEEKYIEFRLPLRGLPYVALLIAPCPRYGFQRAFDVFRVGAERRADGPVEVARTFP